MDTFHSNGGANTQDEYIILNLSIKYDPTFGGSPLGSPWDPRDVRHSPRKLSLKYSIFFQWTKPPYACGQPSDELLCSRKERPEAQGHLRWVSIALPALVAGDAVYLDKIEDAGRHVSATARAVAEHWRSTRTRCKCALRYAL